MGYSARRGFTNGSQNPAGSRRQAELQQRIAQMQAEMDAAQKEVEAQEFSASSGGGAVEVTVTGKKDIVSIKLAEEIVDPEDIETLQDAILAAANEALKQADDENAMMMSSLTSGFGGLGGLPF